MELFSLSRIFMFWFLILLVLGLNNINSELVQDKQALLDFINKTPHGNRPNWNSSDSICNWVGVQCDSNQSYVYSLRLPGIGLLGQIPSNTLSRLTQLRILSLRSNRLSGPIPSDFSNLTSLTNLYLQNNVFSGDFPSSLTHLTKLFRLDLSSNNFTGEIPIAVNNLTHLTGIFLQNNRFNGNLPRIDIKGLISLDVSNNNLNGSIPETLGNFPASSFSGNINLCGKPLNSCNSSSSSPSPSPSPSTQETQIPNKSKSISKSVIIGISIGVGILIILLIVIPFIVKRCKKKPSNPQPRGLVGRSVGREGSSSSMRDEIAGTSEETGGGERHQLVFINGGNYKFDFEDLMRASAEVLGKGSKTTSYKAVLEDEGITIVVKRLKEVGITKNEFELQMELVGKVKHENVVPLRAFYYSSGEKLLIYDFMPNGSLSSLLHGSRGPHRPPLDWNTRKKIALSAGRGLAHLHASGNIVHGDIKSSNILLNEDLEASISDFGLNPLFGSSTPLNRGAGYRAPEVVETRKVTMKSDVYSFGVLLMELLTGKAPATLGDEGIELPRWVQSVVREEWTAEIFDLELTNGVEEEMVRLLEIAMACVSTVPDQRPSMVDVLRMIEDLNSPSIGDNDMVQP